MRPSTRPFFLDLGLALGLLGAWFASCGFEPLIAAATDELRLVVRLTRAYSLQWPLGPAAFGIAGLVLAWLRYRFFASGPELQERLQRATLLAAALLALRFLALYDPLTYFLPFLTLLWSPHALWGVALVFFGYVHLPTEGRSLSSAPRPRIGVALLVLCLPLYFLYALYFCQITMLHGDEGQYLRVSQSLLHDGDMDLANNLGAEHTDEFHVTEFAVHKAPASPEGKVHSVHPIGLSVALVPAYWLGLTYWENPRLAAALFMALLASLCVPLIFLYLTRLGAECWAALLATGIMAFTGPFFSYTNQLYPEIPALLISLVTLLVLAHWQVPGGSYRSLGRWEVLLLGILTLLLCGLPFLHPRYIPLGLLLKAGVLLQAWHNPRRYFALSIVGLVLAASLYAFIAFHYAFSDDWMGPLRPSSGAWAEGALDMAIWPVSLPGHWLHADKGILNSSPIYFFSLFGLLVLARLRDRRIAIAVGLYIATAAINGLHPKWGLGFCFPARFFVTALPVLVLGLAWGLPLLRRTATICFFAGLALAISIESVLNTLVLTESGYEGSNLLDRSINHFYPLHQHFLELSDKAMPLLDMAFWALLMAALFPSLRGLRWAVIATAAFAPFLWSRSNALADRLPQSLSPYMANLSLTVTPLEHDIRLRPRTDATSPDGGLRARPDETETGIVNSSRTGILLPGIYYLTFPGLHVEPSDGQVSGHLIISHGYTVRAVSPWANLTSYPLVGGAVRDDYSIAFRSDRPGVSYVDVQYSGHGELTLDSLHVSSFFTQSTPQLAEIHRFVPKAEETQAHFSNLSKGHYRVRFNLTGSTFARFFDSSTAPVKTAVYAGLASPDQFVEDIRPLWLRMYAYRYSQVTVTNPDYLRPLAEGVHPPWWLSIPFAAGRASELRFVLTQPEDVYCLFHYDGPADLTLTDIVLYRETFDQR